MFNTNKEHLCLRFSPVFPLTLCAIQIYLHTYFSTVLFTIFLHNRMMLAAWYQLLCFIHSDMAEILSKKELGSHSLYYIHYEDCKSGLFSLGLY